MRASFCGKHVSGAERIIEEKDLPQTITELIRRPKVGYDEMVITVERIVGEPVIIERSLPIRSYTFDDVKKARNFAIQCLIDSGIVPEVSRKALGLLERGPSPEGENMRGAVLMDSKTGERLEPDQRRGVRTVRVDWLSRKEVARFLPRTSLTQRSLDAIAIATKNAHCGVLAELCWSDDPDYQTGYVASQKLGYIRIHPLKEKGDIRGGRIYFISSDSRDEVIKCLESLPVLISSLYL